MAPLPAIQMCLRKKRKRTPSGQDRRQTLSLDGRETLEKFFSENPYPDHSEYNLLSGQTDTSVKKVRQWFSNRRYAWKKTKGKSKRRKINVKENITNGNGHIEDEGNAEKVQNNEQDITQENAPDLQSENTPNSTADTAHLTGASHSEITSDQLSETSLQKLEDFFKVNPTPTVLELSLISAKTGIPQSVIVEELCSRLIQVDSDSDSSDDDCVVLSVEERKSHLRRQAIVKTEAAHSATHQSSTPGITL